MIDLFIYIQNSDVTILIKNEQYDEALVLIETRLSKKDIPLENNAHLLLLKAHCNFKLQRYPLTINTLNQILRKRYIFQMDHHILTQAYFLRAVTFMVHGSNKKKNRLAFIDISKCMNLLAFQNDVLQLMDDFLLMVGEK